jgi:hypothetical protein
LEGPGEFVLVNVGGSIEPEEGLNIKLRVVVNDEFGLSKSGGRLMRLIVVKKKISG